MFKFYSVPNIDVLEKIIGKKASLKFSSAFNLNDPFELKFNLTLDPYKEGHYEAFKNVHKNDSLEDFKSWQKQVEDNNGFLWYTEQQQRNTISQTISLCSFTEKNNNNLMRSHYTNNYEGICVEYSDELFSHFETVDGFLAFLKVNYSEQPPSVDFLEGNNSKTYKMMFNKQIEWKYEQENRIVITSKNDTDFFPIQQKFIKAIYIGSRTKRNIENKIIEIGDQNKIDVYHGITVGKTYEVTFQKHKEGTIYTKSFWS